MASTPTNKAIDKALADAAELGHDLDAELKLRVAKRRGAVTWQTGKPPTQAHHNAAPGDDITLPARAAIRLAVLGWVAGVDADNPLAVFDELPADASDELADDLAALDDVPDPELPADGDEGEASLTDLLVPDESAGDASDDATEELLARSAPELVAHLNRFPGDHARVRDAELAQDRPRVTVLRAAGVADDDLPG